MIDAYFKQGNSYVSSYSYGMKRRVKTDVKRESRYSLPQISIPFQQVQPNTLIPDTPST